MRRGYRAHAASDRASALAIAAAHELDLAILDYSMPLDCGLDIAVALRAVRENLEMVICSGIIEDTAKERAKAAGIRWFDKLLSLDQLLHAIDEGRAPTAPTTLSLEELRWRHYSQIVHQHGANITRASEATGIARSTFQRNVVWARDDVAESSERRRRAPPDSNVDRNGVRDDAGQ